MGGGVSHSCRLQRPFAWTCPHLCSLLAGLAVQAAYPPALLQLVVCRLSLQLFPLERGAVAGFQTGLLPRGLVLRLSFDGLHWFHILIGLKLSPEDNNGRNQMFRVALFEKKG